MTSTRDRMLSACRKHIGYQERPDGWTRFGQWYADRHGNQAFARAPWCAAGLSYVAATLGLGKVVGEFAYTPSWAAWFRDNGRWHQSPKAGDLVFFDWQGTKNIPAIDHVGIVEAVLRDGRVVTIEFNTANACMRRVRSRATIAGFGRPAYPDVPVKPSKPKPVNPTEVAVKKLPTLKRGDKGWHVKTLTYLLMARDFAIDVEAIDDTTFTAYHEQGVKGIQAAAGIKTDGVVGPQTWAALLRVA
ncbi:CHAP domain-containing protein [Nonomuraea pusilla]|uniref:Putative peptidoglycan binding domain-containing protein n=1 Tax=Nonomuraea pusilla TaxID=46177 RepID=A0A1H8K388_9ACTN|nr:CHAP domain-containing protein [Nonomuraea pusilla]SEN87519.1 Putative peptidoglycan binding domain-containing protein [Nonomuraea pusilla]